MGMELRTPLKHEGIKASLVRQDEILNRYKQGDREMPDPDEGFIVPEAFAHNVKLLAMDEYFLPLEELSKSYQETSDRDNIKKGGGLLRDLVIDLTSLRDSIGKENHKDSKEDLIRSIYKLEISVLEEELSDALKVTGFQRQHVGATRSVASALRSSLPSTIESPELALP